MKHDQLLTNQTTAFFFFFRLSRSRSTADSRTGRRGMGKGVMFLN